MHNTTPSNYNNNLPKSQLLCCRLPGNAEAAVCAPSVFVAPRCDATGACAGCQRVGSSAIGWVCCVRWGGGGSSGGRRAALDRGGLRPLRLAAGGGAPGPVRPPAPAPAPAPAREGVGRRPADGHDGSAHQECYFLIIQCRGRLRPGPDAPAYTRHPRTHGTHAARAPTVRLQGWPQTACDRKVLGHRLWIGTPLNCPGAVGERSSAG